MVTEWMLSSYTRFRAERIANHLAQFVQAGETILDCGCGSMQIARLLQEQCRVHAFGTDVIRLNHGNHRFCLSSGERLPYENDTFDVVFMMFTLHHMSSPADALMEGWRVSRRRVIVLEDVYETPLELHMLKALDWSGNIVISKDMSFPFNFKTEDEWRAIFTHLGTRLIAVDVIRPVPWRPSRHRVFVLEKFPA